MKILILSAVLFSALAVQAQATDFSFTGFTSQNIDNVWFPGDGGFSQGTFTGGNYLGGPGGNDIGGLAQQFEVSQEVLLSGLDVSAVTSPYGAGTTDVTYNIYSGTSDMLEGNASAPRPDVHSLAFTSVPSAFTSTRQEQITGQTSQVNMQVPVSYDLKPGTYWVAEQGTGPTQVEFTSITYTDPPLNVAQTPEPPVWTLFLALAAFVLLKRKVRVAPKRVV